MVTKDNVHGAMKVIGPGILLLFFAIALPQIYLNSVTGNVLERGTDTIQPSAEPTEPSPGSLGNVKEVTLQFKDYNYYPNTIEVKKGQTLRLVGDLQSSNKLIGCFSYVRIPDFGVQKRLSAGDNVIEFVADKEGTFPFSCGMNMGRGQVVVQA